MKPIVVSLTNTKTKKESCLHNSSSSRPPIHQTNTRNNKNSNIFRRSRLPSNDNTLPAHNLKGTIRRTRSIGCISSGSCQSSLLMQVLKRSTSFIVTPENPHSIPYTMDAFENPFLEEPTETTTMTLDSVSSLSHDSAKRINPNANEEKCPPPPVEIVVQLQRSYSEPMSIYQSESFGFEQRQPSHDDIDDDITVEDWQQNWIQGGASFERQDILRPPPITTWNHEVSQPNPKLLSSAPKQLVEALERSFTDATSPCTCTGTTSPNQHRFLPSTPITPHTTVSEHPTLPWAKHQRFLEMGELPSLDQNDDSKHHDPDTHDHHNRRRHRQTKSCGDPSDFLGNRPRRIIRRHKQLISIGNVVGESTMDSNGTTSGSLNIPEDPKEFRKFMKDLKNRNGSEENDFFQPPRKSAFTRELEMAWQRMKSSIRITPNSADKLALQRSHTGCLT